jgi:hypothetical protein
MVDSPDSQDTINGQEETVVGLKTGRCWSSIALICASLAAAQQPDGYLGTYADAQRWTAWDVWVHKHVLARLLSY